MKTKRKKIIIWKEQNKEQKRLKKIKYSKNKEQKCLEWMGQ